MLQPVARLSFFFMLISLDLLKLHQQQVLLHFQNHLCVNTLSLYLEHFVSDNFEHKFQKQLLALITKNLRGLCL